MGGSAERKAANEAFFRDVNERLEEVAEGVFDAAASAPEVWEFVCECARADCTDRLPLTVSEYETVRADGRRFVVAPGHADPTIERVVDRSSRYWLVEKLGEPGEIAEEQDPRS